MAAPPRRIIGAVVVVLVALSVGAGRVGAAQIDDKRSEAAAIASKLEEQARAIVDLDKEHRKARTELEAADAAVARAEADLASASRRQDEARRLLAAHAQAAYVGGGSVAFLAQMTRATVVDAGARRTYLRVVAGEDRQAIGRLQAAREDLQVRQKSLGQARRVAAQQTDAVVGDLAGLEKAMNGQRALLARANGELAALVASEQQRRDAEAAAARRATLAAATVEAAAPAAPATPAAPPARVTAPPTTSMPAAKPTPVEPAPAPAGAPPPASDSVDATFACIRQLESGNNYKSPGGGAYQFQDATWQSLGYTGSAQDYPPAVQDEAARKLQARDGWRPWTTAPLCGRV
ncbi:MAG: transglycosylase family protein [Acidimicrobiales bacterium]